MRSNFVLTQLILYFFSTTFVTISESTGIVLGWFCFRPYFRRRSNALEGMVVASFLGVGSGIYIWKPFFEEMERNRITRERRELEQANKQDKVA